MHLKSQHQIPKATQEEPARPGSSRYSLARFFKRHQDRM